MQYATPFPRNPSNYFMIPIDLITPLPCYYRHTVTEDLLDVMGHMNIHGYMYIFNGGALNFAEAFGLTQEFIDQERGGIFALEHHIRYLAEVRLGETVAIHHRVFSRTAKRVHFMQFMVNESRPNLACTLEVVNSYANLALRRTAEFPPQIASWFDHLITQHQQLDWDAPVCGVMHP